LHQSQSLSESGAPAPKATPDHKIAMAEIADARAEYRMFAALRMTSTA